MAHGASQHSVAAKRLAAPPAPPPPLTQPSSAPVMKPSFGPDGAENEQQNGLLWISALFLKYAKSSIVISIQTYIA